MKYIFIILAIIIILSASIYLSCSKEKYTNMAGFNVPQSVCGNLTLGDCLETSTCGWCMNDNFTSMCVAGDVHGPKNTVCKKYYSNDPWTRSVLANDNDFQEYLEQPIFS